MVPQKMKKKKESSMREEISLDVSDCQLAHRRSRRAKKETVLRGVSQSRPKPPLSPAGHEGPPPPGVVLITELDEGNEYPCGGSAEERATDLQEGDDSRDHQYVGERLLEPFFV